MRMREFTPKEFVSILVKNGYEYSHHSSNHVSYIKKGNPKIITVNFHERVMSRPMAKRLLKEANISYE